LEVVPYIGGGCRAARVPGAEKVAMAVWMLANQETFREVANLFGLSRGTVHHCIMQVFSAIRWHLKARYIQWPSSAECQRISSEMEAKFGFPGIVGFIDGTHVPIRAPANDRDSYINRKGFASINVLAVCDHEKRFTYIYTDRAGSVHDARVLRVCSLAEKLEAGRLCSADSGGQYHLLGDSAYPLLPSLLVPYRDNGHLSPVQQRFNLVHSSARSVVERAFGRLKGMFRRLRGIESTKPVNAVHVIESAFVLHNFILHNEQDIDNESDDEQDNETFPCCHNVDFGNAAFRKAAKDKRDNVAANL